MEARIPDFCHFFLAILNHFRAYNAPAIVAGQTGGERAVVHDGVAVIITLLHLVGVTAALAANHLVITVLNISIFGGQVRKTLWSVQLDLVIVITHVAGRRGGTGRCGLIRISDLIELNLIGIQRAVALYNVNVSAKQCVIRVVAGCLIGIDGHRQ